MYSFIFITSWKVEIVSDWTVWIYGAWWYYNSAQNRLWQMRRMWHIRKLWCGIQSSNWLVQTSFQVDYYIFLRTVHWMISFIVAYHKKVCTRWNLIKVEDCYKVFQIFNWYIFLFGKKYCVESFLYWYVILIFKFFLHNNESYLKFL